MEGGRSKRDGRFSFVVPEQSCTWRDGTTGMCPLPAGNAGSKQEFWSTAVRVQATTRQLLLFVLQKMRLLAGEQAQENPEMIFTMDRNLSGDLQTQKDECQRCDGGSLNIMIRLYRHGLTYTRQPD
jgi:hypothetical protein